MRELLQSGSQTGDVLTFAILGWFAKHTPEIHIILKPKTEGSSALLGFSLSEGHKHTHRVASGLCHFALNSFMIDLLNFSIRSFYWKGGWGQIVV